jgi:hypothetical protein
MNSEPNPKPERSWARTCCRHNRRKIHRKGIVIDLDATVG